MTKSWNNTYGVTIKGIKNANINIGVRSEISIRLDLYANQANPIANIPDTARLIVLITGSAWIGNSVVKNPYKVTSKYPGNP